MTQASTRPPTFVAFCSKPQDLPKTYLEVPDQQSARGIRSPGTPIRLNLRKGDNPFRTERGRRS